MTLRNEKKWYQTLFEHAPISMWEVDFSGIKPLIESIGLAKAENPMTALRKHHKEIANEYPDLPPIKVSTCCVRLFQKLKGGSMVNKGYTPEQIINKLREAEILLSQGASVPEASRKIGIVEQTYYRWRKEYGGMRVEQAKRLKDLEKENARLKKLVADLSLDNSILKEVARGNF